MEKCLVIAYICTLQFFCSFGSAYSQISHIKLSLKSPGDGLDYFKREDREEAKVEKEKLVCASQTLFHLQPRQKEISKQISSHYLGYWKVPEQEKQSAASTQAKAPFFPSGIDFWYFLNWRVSIWIFLSSHPDACLIGVSAHVWWVYV